MRAVTYQGVERVAVSDVPEPIIQEPQDAIVRVTTSAICGSDLHAYHGRFPLKPGETLGHEAVGVVQAVGTDVSRVRVGDRVILSFDNVCGRCWYCVRGETSLCDRFGNLGFGEHGGGLNGVQAEAARVRFADVNLLAIPAGMEDERALFVGDILTTGFYGAALALGGEGGTIAVVGAGPVGYFVAQAARELGADQVVVLDRVPDRLALAAATGAAVVDVDREDPKAAVRRLTEGRGADASVEAVGDLRAYATALAVIRRGGRVAVVGVYGDETLEVPMASYWSRGVKVLFAGVCQVHAWWERALAAVAEGRVDPLPIISHRLSLEEAPAGYGLFDRHEATKVVLRP